MSLNKSLNTSQLRGAFLISDMKTIYLYQLFYTRIVCPYVCVVVPPPASSWWMRSAKLGSSPHQKSQSSLRPCRWLRRHTLNTSALRQRLKLHKIGSSSVTGKRMGAEVGPCHTYLFHLIPVRSACGTREEGRRREREGEGEKENVWVCEPLLQEPLSTLE